MKRILIAVSVIAIVVALHVAAFAGGMPELTESDKAPMINLFQDSPPRIADVTVYPEKPYNDEGITISARVFADKDEASMAVAQVEIWYRFDGAAKWEKFDMLKSPLGDDKYFAALLPPEGAKRLEYSIVAHDLGGNTAFIAPPTSKMDIADESQFLWVGDTDEDAKLVPPEIDITGIGVARDADNLYVITKTKGEPSPGNLSKEGANFYFVPFFPPGEGIASFLGGSGIVLGYTPLAASILGIPKYGLFNIKDIISGNKNLPKTGVKMVKGKNGLTFTVPFKDLPKGDEWVIGGATGRITTGGGIAPIDASYFARIILRGGELALAPAEDRKPAALKAGASSFDISPPVGTPLAGYGDRVGVPSKGKHDILTGTAIVIETDNRFYCFVGLDFFYMRVDFYDDIAKRVNKATGLPETCIFVGASHSHHASGAMSPELSILGGKFQRDVYESVIDRISNGIIKAYEDRKPAKLGTGWAEMEPGKLTNGNRRNDKGKQDAIIGVIRVDNMDDSPLATLFIHSGHPTGIESKKMMQSSDFVGPAREAITRQGGGIAVFFNGSLGDHSARCYGDCPADDFDKVKKEGGEIAEYVVKARKSIKTSDEVEIRSATQWLLLNRQRQVYTVEKAFVINKKTAFLTIPGELFFDPFGSAFREQAKSQGYDQLFVMGLTDDGLAYIYPEEMYYAHDYESSYSAFGPKLSGFLVNNATDLVKWLGTAK